MRNWLVPQRGSRVPPLILAAGECFLFLVAACLALFYFPIYHFFQVGSHSGYENHCRSGHFCRCFCSVGKWASNGCGGKHLRGGCIASLSKGSLSTAEDVFLINSGVLSLYCCANQAQMWTPQLQKIIRAVLTADASQEGGKGSGLLGGTILMLLDRDPSHISTCVKMNQA